MSELKDKLIEKILPHVRFQSRDIAHQLIVDLCTATGLTPEILEQIASGEAIVVPADSHPYLHTVQLNRPVVKS